MNAELWTPGLEPWKLRRGEPTEEGGRERQRDDGGGSESADARGRVFVFEEAAWRSKRELLGKTETPPKMLPLCIPEASSNKKKN